MLGPQAGDHAEVVPNEFGEPTHASVVSFLGDGRVVVGNEAKRNIVVRPESTVFSAKRLMGRFSFSEEVRKARERMPYAIVDGPDNSVRIKIGNEEYSPPEIGALILREMRRIVEKAVGQPVNKAVITVPAYFNDNQRNATKDAGIIAGLDVLRIINEPTAAALAYGLGGQKKERVALYDLGGGTFDISILDIENDLFEVLSTAGDTYLGGDDFDDRIVDNLLERFKSGGGTDVRGQVHAMQKLREAAEKAKIALSEHESVQIQVPLLATDASGYALDLSTQLGRQDLNKMTIDLVQRTFKVCDEALHGAGIGASDVDQVVLVGGSTRVPLVRKSVEHYFARPPLTTVNPDEVVALGAAIQAHLLLDDSKSSVLLDVTPLSLRIGTVGGYTESIIERNTPVPIERTRVFTTATDNQSVVRIKVYQGESNRAEENTLLGEFEFSGFPPRLRGETEVEVTFDINTDGILQVMAKETQSGVRTGTCINLSAGLSEHGGHEAALRNEGLSLVSSGGGA